VDLFNTEQFWHAHEAWERCWRATSGEEAAFYQGLIQAAAALVHWQRGNPRGLAQNWAKGRRRLTPLPPHYHNTDLATLIAAMDAFTAGSPTASSPPPRLVCK
jgi:predicted metal-dependent hydrolase